MPELDFGRLDPKSDPFNSDRSTGMVLLRRSVQNTAAAIAASMILVTLPAAESAGTNRVVLRSSVGTLASLVPQTPAVERPHSLRLEVVDHSRVVRLEGTPVSVRRPVAIIETAQPNLRFIETEDDDDA